MASKKITEVWGTVSVKPLTGILDTRSSVEDSPLGSWRYKSNYQIVGGDKLQTRPGHDKLLASFASTQGVSYSNFDFHDQGNVGPVPPQMVTMLLKAQDNFGNRYLYAGNQSSIAYLNQSTGLWTTISQGFGGTPVTGLPATRWRASENAQQILFVNNVDRPLLANVNSPAMAGQIPDLNALGVTAGAITIQFAGFTFLMDVFQDGIRQSARVRWSDINNPAAWIPATVVDGIPSSSSLAGFQDLDYGSQILGAAIMASNLYIFTTKAIWICFSSSNTIANVLPATFAFTRIYAEPKNGAKCLAYPNTLVSEGNAVWYAATDGIYYFDPYTPEPIREEWLYKGSSLVFNDNLSALNPTCCQSPVAEIFPDDQEIYLSWPEVSANPNGGCINSKTLVWNYQYKSVDIVDFGYSAFANFQTNQSNLEGCPPAQILVAASCTGTDWALKEIGTIYSRTRCTNMQTSQGKIVNGIYTPFAGEYVTDGYYRILRMLMPFLNLDRNKEMRSILLEAIPTAQASPCIMQVRFGTTYSETDPNLPDGLCTVPWVRLTPQAMVCLDTMTASQYVTANIRRNNGFEFNYLVRGRFVYVEFRLANADGSPAIGGLLTLARLEAQVRLAAKGD